MQEEINIAGKIENNLPDELKQLIEKVVGVAGSMGLRVYLVGGIVRDMLLGIPNFDIDIVVEGNAIGLANAFSNEAGGRLVPHPMFNTAKVSVGKRSIDFAMARTETYGKPGALPVVKPGDIKTDLFRRDFTVNALAVSLNRDNYGELIDIYHGLADLQGQCIRILHENSFIDDPTRIWRAIRYEQRLGFEIESVTLNLLKRDVSTMRNAGGYRLRRELELALREKEPEKILHRAWVLKALQQIHPSLKGDKWLSEKFREARESGVGTGQEYLCILTARLDDEEFARFTHYLRLPKQTVNQIAEMRNKEND